jgi:hypothetical protein
MIEPLHEVHSVDMVHDPASYKVLYLFLALLAGNVQCRVHVLCGGVHGSAMLEQQHHNVHDAQSGGDVERRLLLLKHRLFQQLAPRKTELKGTGLDFAANY